jgi:hypothetical protein
LCDHHVLPGLRRVRVFRELLLALERRSDLGASKRLPRVLVLGPSRIPNDNEPVVHNPLPVPAHHDDHHDHHDDHRLSRFVLMAVGLLLRLVLAEHGDGLHGRL